jgi:protein-S-isoprenylcysteine O-methyltransferase Ste14
MFILIPLTLFFIFVGVKIDALLGLLPFISWPYNLLFFVFFMVIGLIIVLWSYSYLIFEGRLGLPFVYFGQTNNLVKVGPYSIVRHPAVIGKIFGVMSLGFLFQSFSFTFIIVPLLIVASLIDKRFREERQLERKWGRTYIEYRESVPMIIPHMKRMIHLIKKEVDKRSDDKSMGV